eukprot:5854435-Amphidinium_carterae.2
MSFIVHGLSLHIRKVCVCVTCRSLGPSASKPEHAPGWAYVQHLQPKCCYALAESLLRVALPVISSAGALARRAGGARSLFRLCSGALSRGMTAADLSGGRSPNGRSPGGSRSPVIVVALGLC